MIRCEEHVGEPFVRRCEECAALAGAKGRLPVDAAPEAVVWPRVSTPPNPWAGADA